MEKISFKEYAHEELLNNLTLTNCCSMAFLSAVFKVCGTLNFKRKRMNAICNLSSYPKAIKVVEFLKQLYPFEFEINVEHAKLGSKKSMNHYQVIVPTGFTNQVLQDLELIGLENEDIISFKSDIPNTLLSRRCCCASYLKGLFFSCGSVYVPSMSIDDEKKTKYHFEYQFEDETTAENCQHLLLNLDISSKINERGNVFLVYIKDKDEILNILSELGLGESASKLKSIIDEREIANSLNRSIICETANLDKTYEASARHLLAISTIEQKEGLSKLTPYLRETALARIEYPHDSLIELSNRLKVSKSCLNHRLRKIVEISQIDV